MVQVDTYISATFIGLIVVAIAIFASLQARRRGHLQGRAPAFALAGLGAITAALVLGWGVYAILSR